MLETGSVRRFLAAAGQRARGGAVAVAMDALLFEHLLLLQAVAGAILLQLQWAGAPSASRCGWVQWPLTLIPHLVLFSLALHGVASQRPAVPPCCACGGLTMAQSRT
uniref:Uncharacterized protein n=1 Tax=Oryza glumipatula TaxID=40148 RepID=A0A0E0BHZ8_9ORYZ